jgi:hypothetical protein
MFQPGGHIDKGQGFHMSEQPAENGEAEFATENTVELPSNGEPVSDQAFEEVVSGALGAVGGTLLFKMRVDQAKEPHHAAAAFVGQGESRQFLILTMPIAGGHLSVETTAKSKSPIAGIAAAYANLADAFSHAA